MILKAALAAVNIEALAAEVLLSHCLQKPRSFLYAHPKYVLPIEVLTQFKHLVARHHTGEPIAYITGQQEFWSLTFKVTPDTLTPRPETEHLVEWALATLPNIARIADLGTGSGAIAVALASERPNWEIIATDMSESALAIAQQNGATYPNIDFRLGHWCEPLTGKFDAIISNPPYIDPQDKHLSALQHEPQSALVASDHGLADLKAIIHTAPAYLKPHGWLALEHGFNQGSAVRAALVKQVNAVSTQRDLAGLERFSVGQRD